MTSARTLTLAAAVAASAALHLAALSFLAPLPERAAAGADAKTRGIVLHLRPAARRPAAEPVQGAKPPPPSAEAVRTDVRAGDADDAGGAAEAGARAADGADGARATDAAAGAPAADAANGADGVRVAALGRSGGDASPRSGGGAAPARSAAPLPGPADLPPPAAGAPGAADGARGPAGEYLRQVAARIARHKRYPHRSRQRSEEGTVTVRLTIERDGAVGAAAVEEGSGYRRLDEEALAMIRRARPLPRIPPEVPGERLDLRMPIRFSLR